MRKREKKRSEERTEREMEAEKEVQRERLELKGLLRKPTTKQRGMRKMPWNLIQPTSEPGYHLSSLTVRQQ